MTHDELVAKIIDPDGLEWGKRTDALRAVVELHKPGNSGNCQVCIYADPVESVPYPCPTIQAIEAELK